MEKNARQNPVWVWLTLPIAVLLAIAAGGGLLVPDLYRDNPSILAQAIGQDLVSLAIALPILIASGLLTQRGSSRARLIWLGVLVYLIYTYVTYAFAIQYNSLFLVYVALLGCSLYALIGGLATTDVAAIKAGFTGKAPVKTVSIFLAVLAVLFYLLWLSEIVPPMMAGEVPQSVLEDGTPTNAVYVVDMAWILPAFAITAGKLWRKQALGYTLAGTLLTYFALLVLAILAMGVFQALDNQPGAVPMAALFGILFITGTGMLVWYLRGFQGEAIRRNLPIPASSA